MREGNLIVSFGCNDRRYEAQLRRLTFTLKKFGWTGGFFKEWHDNYPLHEQVPYAFNTNILEGQAYNTNYKNLLWLDTSMYIIAPPHELFERIDKEGYYFSENGYDCSQSVNDNCLSLFNISRDEAANIREVSSGCVGINLETDIGREILRKWKYYTDLGGTKGSRVHNPEESSDPRFLFHRQDQSVLSLVAYKLGLKPGPMNEFWSYGSSNGENQCKIICQGI